MKESSSMQTSNEEIPVSLQKDLLKFQDFPGPFLLKFQNYFRTFNEIPGLSKTFTELSE